MKPERNLHLNILDTACLCLRGGSGFADMISGLCLLFITPPITESQFASAGTFTQAFTFQD